MAVLGVVASLGIGVALRAQQRRGLDAVMDRRVALVAEAVASQVGRYVDTLRTAAGAVGAFETLTATKFAQIAAPVAGLHLAGVTSLVYLVETDEAHVGAVQRLWRSRGDPGLVLVPDQQSADHVFTIFTAALGGGPRVVPGTDLGRYAVPSAALSQARRSGQVAISDPYVLIRDRSLPAQRRQLSFVLTTALYGPPDADGVRPFRGWLLMGLRSATFLGDSLTRISQGTVDVTLRTADPAGRPVTVATLRAPAAGRRSLHRVVEVPVAQDRWTLTVDAGSTTLPGSDALPVTVAAAGLLLTAALSVLVCSLVTNRARAEARVAYATAELTTSEALLRQQKADLTAFAGVVAHDLRAPLATVLAYAELLRDELADIPTASSAGLREPVEKITGGIQRMGTLIDDLLTYATAREAGIRSVDLDLHALAEEVAITHLDAASAARRPMPTIYVGALPAVHADPALIRQLLHNLIGNAIKYTPAGRAPRVDVTAYPAEHDRVGVQIADRGLGIPAGQHDAVFSGFHRAHIDSGIPGTGLGLAICHRIIERHDGSITAGDNPGGGTIISFTLPAASGTPVAATCGQSSAPRPGTQLETEPHP